jgi:hypothetical protein
LNIPAWRKCDNRYSARNIPDVAVDFLASATGWALHKQSGVGRDATRLRGDEAPTVPPLAVGIVMSRLAHYYAIARIAAFAADHVGPIQRFVFTKVGIERAIHTTCLGLNAIHDCNLLSLDMETPSTTFHVALYFPAS